MIAPLTLPLILAPVRTFLSPDNAFGFGLGDFIELIAAALAVSILVLFIYGRTRLSRFATKTGWCMLCVGLLPILLRLALLQRSPVPTPSGADDFGYILLADTLRHLRLANPPHPFPDFFEQLFVLQRPTYSSMYPLGQGIVWAFGWALFGTPWAGVLIAIGMFCALCYWMLRAWTTPAWALAGGVFAALEFGPLSYWTNSYWGGAVSAAAGCLVFGALPRLTGAHPFRSAILVGLGLGIQLLTRPFEFFLLALSVALFFLIFDRTRLIKHASIAAITLLPAAGLMLLHNHSVTRTWTTLPYFLYRYQYGVPATFTFQSNALPHRELNSEQELDYKAETIIHGDAPETLTAFAERLLFRIRFYRFFLYAPLYPAFFVFLLRASNPRIAWALETIGIFAVGSNFHPYFYPHYIAAVASLFVLAAVGGLEQMSLWKWHNTPAGLYVAALLATVSVTQFAFWYGAYLFAGNRAPSALTAYDSWDFINYGDPQGRILIDRTISQTPGKHVVFVHYRPGHMFHEWIHNAADIDASRVIWVHDLGPGLNEQLRKYYPGRHFWILDPDAYPPKLDPYPEPSTTFSNVE